MSAITESEQQALEEITRSLDQKTSDYAEK